MKWNEISRRGKFSFGDFEKDNYNNSNFNKKIIIK